MTFLALPLVLLLQTATPSPAPTSTVTALWDGFLGNLVSAVIGGIVSFVVAIFVLRRTRDADDERARDQREAERAALQQQIDADRQALAEQIEASRRMAEETAERDKRIARERASLEAAEALTGVSYDCVRVLTDAHLETERGERERRWQRAWGDYNAAALLKVPALDDARLRRIVEEGAVALANYAFWARERDPVSPAK